MYVTIFFARAQPTSNRLTRSEKTDLKQFNTLRRTRRMRKVRIAYAKIAVKIAGDIVLE